MPDGSSEDCERERVTSGETNMDTTNENMEKETPQVMEENTQGEAEVTTSPENTQQTSTQSLETSPDNVQSQNNNTDQQVMMEADVQETTNNDYVNFTDDISIVQETINNDSMNFTADVSTAQETTDNESMNFTADISSVQEATNNDSMDFTADISGVQEATNNDSMDFTADISLDQFNPQKDITDEEVMQHLDVIENIDLNPQSFGVSQSIDQAMQSESSKNDEEEQNKKQEREEITIIDDENIEEQWYKEKLQRKDTLLKHRMSKLARVLTVSYPHYGKWLERIERITGTPICRIDPPRSCSTNKLHGNRWKFACNEKVLEDPQNTDNPSSSVNKNGKVVWSVELVSGSITGDKTDVPAFVLQAVKIFEDFLQTTIKQTFQENSDEVSIIEVKKEMGESDEKQEWLWLLVRCNSIDELMLFATGKNISRGTMDRLKQTYEYGAGNNCNVKSFYCKSINKCDDKVNVVTTFLVGAEALEEAVGDLKLQLAPKTNFWSSAAGAWNLVKTVKDMLNPTPKTTLIEIGCGIGVIGLSLASQCREVIGVDTPTEVEEAEMTAELNKIFNVSFIVGTPAEVVSKLNSARDLHNKNRSTFCIINTNTVMGRAIEVMTCLRKLTSLRRIVMITTMTKQSVRAILELARPIEGGLGHPFMPIRACAVDILPNGSYFESIILMERRLMHRLTQPWFIEMLEEESKSMANSGTLEKIIERNDNVDLQLRKNPLAKFEVEKQLKNKNPAKSGGGSPVKGGKAKLKRDRSPDIIELPEKVPKKLEKPGSKPWKQAKKKNWNQNNSSICINPLFEKKAKDNKDQTDLREKLSSGRTEMDLIQKVNESRKILEAAKEQLSGPSPKVDATTAKELKNVLSLVLDQTPRSSSVWDRIAPPENDYKMQRKKDIDNDPLLKDRFIHETHAQDILITMPNKEYLETDVPKPKQKLTKYHNLPPLDPDIMPINTANKQSSQKGFNNKGRQQNQNNPWNKNKNFDRNRWNDAGRRNDDVPNRNRIVSSPTREYLAPPEDSPPRRHFSPERVYQAHESPSYREYPPQKRLISPSRQSASGGRRQMTSPRRPYSPVNRTMSPPRRLMDSARMISPARPQRLAMSPPRRQASPEMKYGDSSTWYPVRQSTSPVRRQLSPERRRPVSPVSRMSPSKQRDMMLSRRQSPPKQFSPHQMPQRLLSPPRRQQSPPRHQNAPPNRFADDWDIPSRGAFEQGGVWQRSANERQPTTTSGNWPQTSGDDRFRKPSNQDRPWNTRDSSSHGNSWSANSGMKESWQSSENRWSGPSGSGMSNENWNRNKDSRGGHKETQIWDQSIPNDPWNQEDAEDWNDLPEDARDPWGDEDNVGLKERQWTNESKSVWRETNTVEPWARSKDNWQNKSQAFPIKIPSQNKMNDSRWTTQRESLVSNDMNKKSLLSTNWQLNVGSNNWQSQQNYNQSQAQRFVSNMLKNRR